MRDPQNPKDADATVMERPSNLRKKLQIYARVIGAIEPSTGSDLWRVVKEKMLLECYWDMFDKGPLEWVTTSKAPKKGAVTSLSYASWYSDLLKKHITSAIFAPSRKAFVTKLSSGLQLEHYASTSEFRALAEVIGPNGFKLIDRNLLKIVKRLLSDLKKILETNRTTLERMTDDYSREAACNEAISQLSNLDTFMEKALQLGNVLTLRRLMWDSLGDVSYAFTPLLRLSAASMLSQYSMNYTQNQDCVPVDELALEVGLPVNMGDPALKAVMQPIAKESADLWDFLPFMFAAGFHSSIWLNAVYRPKMQAYSNGANVLLESISSLISGMKGLSCNEEEAPAAHEILKLMHRFVEVSAVIILRWLRLPLRELQKTHKFASLGSVVIFTSLVSFVCRFWCSFVPWNVCRCPFVFFFAGVLSLHLRTLILFSPGTCSLCKSQGF